VGTGPFCVGPQGLAEALGAADIVDWIGLGVPDVGIEQLCALWTISPTRGPEPGTRRLNVRPSYPCPHAGQGLEEHLCQIVRGANVGQAGAD
jgi:hypothetical protein